MTRGIMTLRAHGMMYSIAKLSIMTFDKTTQGKMTHSILTESTSCSAAKASILTLIAELRINDTHHNNAQNNDIQDYFMLSFNVFWHANCHYA